MNYKGSGSTFRKNAGQPLFWKYDDLEDQPLTKAKQIQDIQNEQVYLKQAEQVENRKTAVFRGMAVAQHVQLKRLEQKEPKRKAAESRLKSAQTERDRARRVAASTPPPREISPQPEQRPTAEFYSTRYLGTWTKDSNAYQASKSSNQGNAVLDAVLLRETQELEQENRQLEIQKRKEEAALRHRKANEKQRTIQSYESVMTDLELAHREEISRKCSGLTMKPLMKRSAVPSNLPTDHSDKQKKLETQVKSVLFPDLYGKSKNPIEEMRLQRLQCMKKWRQGSIEAVFDPEEVADVPKEDSSPDLFNQAGHESTNGSIFIFDVNDSIIASQESGISEKFLDKPDDTCDGYRNISSDSAKSLQDACTQTLDKSQPPQALHQDIEHSTIQQPGNSPLCSEGLKLGSQVTVPRVPKKIPPQISELIHKTASKTLKPTLSSGVTARVISSSDSGENKECVTAQKQETTSVMKQSLFRDISSDVLPVVSDNFVHPKTPFGNFFTEPSLKMTRKVISLTPEPETAEKKVASPTPETPVKMVTSFTSEPDTAVKKVVVEPADPIYSRGRLFRSIKLDSTVIQEENESREKRTLQALDSQLNVLNNKAPPHALLSVKARPESFLENGSESKLKDESQNKENVKFTAPHESSHTNFFCKTQFFRELPQKPVPAPPDQTNLSQSKELFSTSTQGSPVVPSSEHSSRSSQVSTSSKDTSDTSDIVLPSFIRHSLVKSLQEMNRPASDENIHRLLESYVAFENLNQFVHPPPPVSFPAGVKGTENVVPHELSTIIEVDTPQTSIVRSKSKSFMEMYSSSVDSVQDALSSNTAKKSDSGVDKKVLAVLSPSLSIPSSLSAWSTLLKSGSPTVSTSSSQLSEAFNAGKIQIHSTPIKKKPTEESTTECDIIDQTLTLVDGFSLDSQMEINPCPSITSSPSKPLTPHKGTPGKEKLTTLQVFPEYKQLPNRTSLKWFLERASSSESLKSSGNSLVTLSPVTSNGLIQSSGPSLIGQHAGSDTVESDSLLSFVMNEQNFENYSNVTSSFFK